MLDEIKSTSIQNHVHLNQQKVRLHNHWIDSQKCKTTAKQQLSIPHDEVKPCTTNNKNSLLFKLEIIFISAICVVNR